jgi:hypothetical protein
VTSEPPAGAPRADTPADGGSLVAMLFGDGLQLDPRAGTPRLPRVPDTDWDDHEERLLGHPTAVPMAPAHGLAGNSGRRLFLMAVRGPVEERVAVLPLDRLDDLDEDAEVVSAVRTAVARWRGGLPLPPRRPDWYRPAWWDEIEAWVDARLADLDRPRTGPLRTVRLWSLSAVLEVPTAAGSLYVKATCEWFRHEPVLTATVARMAPRRSPQVLAVDVARAWMLMERLPGTPHRGPRAPGLPGAAGLALAEVQLASLGHREALLAAGCPDRGEDATLAGLARVLRDGVEVGLLDPGERAALRESEAELAAAVRELYACGLPVVLSHGDLHLDNVASEGPDVVFLDWTDACLSHPFLDAAHLARSAAEEHPDGAEEVWAAFLPAWRAVAPTADLDRARLIAPRVDVVFQAVSYEGILRATEQGSVHDMEGVQAHLLRSLLAGPAGRG